MVYRKTYYIGEAKEMAKCILKGYSVQQTADEFETSKETVRRRIKLLGLTTECLVEIRKNRQSKKTRADINLPLFFT